MNVLSIGNPVLVTARVAGRATRVSQDSVLAMARGFVSVANWTKERVVCSAKFLHPLVWCKNASGWRAPEKKSTEGMVSGAPPKVSKKRIMPVAVALETRSSEAFPAEIDIRAREKVPQAKAKPTRRPAKPQPVRHQKARRVEAPSEVTANEVSAAVFAGVAEKVMFSRALRDLSGGNDAARARAVGILGGISHPLSVKALSARLAVETSADVRKECVNALTSLGNPAGLPAVERSLSDESGAVRLAAVRGVYRLAGTRGAVSLVRMFADEDEDVRRRATACVGWLGQTELAPELLPLLRGDSASVRLAALEALENLKSTAVADAIIALLDDPEESVQRKAFEVLPTITGKQMGEGFPKDEDGRRFLIARWRAWLEEQPHRS